MGVNNPYFPSNVLNTEEALQYLGALSKATRTQRYAAKTGSPTLTGAEMADAVVEISGGSTATITTATGPQIIAAMQALDANADVGSIASFTIVNGNSGTVTLAANATGVTLVGADVASVLTDTSKPYQIKILTASTVSITAA